MKRLLLRDGQSKRLVWGADGAGKFRGKEYFDSLALRDQAKFDPHFARLAETGQIRNTEKFRQEADNLFVFKIFKHRLVCFFTGRDVVLIYGFMKKSDKGRRMTQNLKTAARLRDEHLAS